MKKPLILTLATLLPAAAHAVDGQVLITHAKALAGNVTPGDAPGYPVTLSKEGSYKLAGNLAVGDNLTSAIQVTANHVNIDLNGFTVWGPNTCSTKSQFPASGWITCTYSQNTVSGINGGNNTDVSVSNGTVRGFDGNGLWLGHESKVDKVLAEHNQGYGIVVRDRGMVRNSQATLNRTGGISAGYGGIISDSIASKSGWAGLKIGVGGLVKHSTAFGNGTYGIYSDNGASDKSGVLGSNLFGNGTDSISGPVVSLGGNLCGNGSPC